MSLEKLKLAAGVVLLSPYIPMLFMGEEYGETAPFQYFVSHEDARLIAAVRKGRAEEFARFHWKEEMTDPQGESTFVRSKLNWEVQAGGKHRTIREFYRVLLDVRARIPALSELNKTNQEVLAFAGQETLFIRRWSGKNHVFVAFHFGETYVEIEAPVPAGRWKPILNSANQAERIGDAEDSEYLDSKGMVRLRMAPWQFCLFTRAGDHNE
jgi:maltooligosyltrehalose trehalohydrolase